MAAVDASADASTGFRERVRTFLAENLPADWRGLGAIENRDEADRFVNEWRSVLARNGMIGVAWPAEYGGAGLSKLEQVVLVEEFARAGVPAMGFNDTFSVKMLGNTLLKWGTEDQKQQFLPRIMSGEDRWCQGYSEPGSGSDLASLRCAARLVGDSWLIDGQQVWTSRALEANWIFLLARTSHHEHKPHRGITFLLVPMDQPGVEVRPIRSLSGESEFNEVFFDGATTQADHVVGAVDEGWSVAMTLLGLERGEEAATNPLLFRAELDRLFALARERGVNTDPVIRQRLADAYIRCDIMRMLGGRILHGVLATGTLGPEASISKLYWSDYHQLVTNLALDVWGAEATAPTGRLPLRSYRADDPGAPNTTGSWIGAFYNATAGTIYVGTSQVQRNILGESVLGLPR